MKSMLCVQSVCACKNTFSPRLTLFLIDVKSQVIEIQCFQYIKFIFVIFHEQNMCVLKYGSLLYDAW